MGRLLFLWLAIGGIVNAEVRMQHEPLLANTVCGMQLYQLAAALDANLTFEVKRSLRDYHHIFGHAFLRALKGMEPDETWLDAGSGVGYATAEYQAGRDLASEINRFSSSPHPHLANVPRGKTLAITVKLPTAGKKVLTTLQEGGHAERHRTLEGRYIEDIPAEEIGKVKVITDFFGPLAYSTDPAAVMNKYLEVAQNRATIFIAMGEAKTFVKSKNGTFRPLEGYFSHLLKGHRVSGGGSGDPLTIQLTSTGARKIPRLKLIEIREGSPPYRIFEEVEE